MTDKPLEQCPKCSSKITNPVECETCGIVFEKYLQAEARKHATAQSVTVETKGSGNRRVVILALSLLLIAAVAAAYWVGRSQFGSEAGRGTPEYAQSGQTGKGKTAPSSPATQSATSQRNVPEDDPTQRALRPAIPVLNPWGTTGSGSPETAAVQRALRATVTVRTSWGTLGSGFFISNHAVITNKHVVTFDDAEYQTFKNRVERNRKIIDLEIERIDEAKNKIQQLPAGPTRSQYELIIQGKEADVEKARPQQRSDEEKLATLKAERYSQIIKIVTADNQEYTIYSIRTSADHDLALLQVSSISGPFLGRDPQHKRLEEGQDVYAIGSPLGLSRTVTKGVFSGYRKLADTGEPYLQHDAPINPGNSGGPLIDTQGNVLGINTMVAAQALRIGFAIPIEVVFEDFGDAL